LTEARAQAGEAPAPSLTVLWLPSALIALPPLWPEKRRTLHSSATGIPIEELPDE
jgi:hypothetical protein